MEDADLLCWFDVFIFYSVKVWRMLSESLKFILQARGYHQIFILVAFAHHISLINYT